MISRRRMMQAAGLTALAAPMASGAVVSGMRSEGRDTPKLCMNVTAAHLDEAALRRVVQLGVTHVLMGGPRIPWEESEIRARMEKLKAGDLTLASMMIVGFPNATYGRPGRAAEIEKVQQSIRAAGRAGLPVVEYNFYAHGSWKAITRSPAEAPPG